MDRGLDRRPGGKDSDLSDEQAKKWTEGYIHMCLAAIEFARDSDELREWFRVERRDRFDRYGLTRDQIDRLVLGCKDRVAILQSRAQRVA